MHASYAYLRTTLAAIKWTFIFSVLKENAEYLGAQTLIKIFVVCEFISVEMHL